MDEVSVVYRVTVRGPPGPSAGVKCSRMGSTTGQVSWVAGNDHGDPILAYVIEAQTDRNYEWRPVKENFTVVYDPRGEYTANLSGLAAWSAYQFRVRSINSFGYVELFYLFIGELMTPHWGFMRKNFKKKGEKKELNHLPEMCRIW